MIMNAILLFLTLILSTLIVAFEFQLLLHKEINFRQALKTYCIAVALNRLLLTGSGYATSSWKLKNDNIPLYKTLSAFAIIEVLSIAPWLAAGFFFGARVGREFPMLFAGIICVLACSAFFLRKKIAGFFKKFSGYIREIKYAIFAIIPFVCLNFLLGIAYYYLFFKLFGIALHGIKIVKIISIAFTIGYFSFLPSGVGIKEGGMVLMLMREKVPLAQAFSFAVADRIVTTVFYLALGLLFGSQAIKEEVKARLRKK